MPQPPYGKRVVAMGTRFAPFRRARQFAADLVARGQRGRGRLGTAAGACGELGRHRSKELGRIVRSGVDRQFSALGLVTQADLAALERRMRPAPGAKTAPAKKKVNAKRDRVRKSAPASTTKRAR